MGLRDMSLRRLSAMCHSKQACQFFWYSQRVLSKGPSGFWRPQFTMSSNPNKCAICGNETNNQLHQAREMFRGTREPFTYLECSSCGTIQLQQIPDLQAYYSDDYYSLQPPKRTQTSGPIQYFKRSAAGLLRRIVADYYCGRRSFFTDLVFHQISQRSARQLIGFPDHLKDAQLDLGINRGSAILDIGSGAGHSLVSLSHFGFEDLTGIDPFIAEDVTLGEGVRLLKGTLGDLNQQYDLIMANHSLEHVSDPQATLREIYRLLKPSHYAIIRMPVIANAWRKYGTNWVQLDAPRHSFLFTVETFSQLAKTAGFAVKEIQFDSTAFQFWGSEQYLRDVPLRSDRSYFVNAGNSAFTAEEIASYSAEAAELNARGEGDQAAFYLCKE
jgi:2-polyprenyl-3-methyl-5-hydroxy-6-metoxy-1,4-benzoquinol methylase